MDVRTLWVTLLGTCFPKNKNRTLLYNHLNVCTDLSSTCSLCEGSREGFACITVANLFVGGIYTVTQSTQNLHPLICYHCNKLPVAFIAVWRN